MGRWIPEKVESCDRCPYAQIAGFTMIFEKRSQVVRCGHLHGKDVPLDSKYIPERIIPIPDWCPLIPA